MIDAARNVVAAILGPGPADLHELARALDRLLAVYHDTPDSAPEDEDRDPPDRSHLDDYTTIAARFPMLGLYPNPDPAVIEGDLLIGDAINDLADIARDMSSVVWLWENVSEAEARWYFRLHYFHWGTHLVDVRRYLHEIIYRVSVGLPLDGAR